MRKPDPRNGGKPLTNFYMKFEQLTFYRTRIYIGLLLCIITASAHGQAQDSLANYKKWSIGFKGGAALSFIIPTDEAVTYERARIGAFQYQGVTYGGIVRYMTEKNFGLQVEANYVEKGWKEIFRSTIDQGGTRPKPILSGESELFGSSGVGVWLLRKAQRADFCQFGHVWCNLAVL